jgi:hypothetical protein
MSPSPTLPLCMKISWQAGEVYYWSILIEHVFWRNLRKFLKTSTVVTQVDKICSRILWTWSAWHTCLGWYCNPQLLQPWFSTNFRASPLPSYHNDFIARNFQQFALRKIFWTTPHIFTWSQSSWKLRLQPIVASNFFRWRSLRRWDFWATTCCCLGPFRWESLRGWDFRPQFVVVSGLFGGNPFVDGILGHNLLLSRAFSMGIPSWMGF